MTKVFRLEVVPCPKPRMTQRDRWAKRKCVLQFYAFRDAVRKYIAHDLIITAFPAPTLEFESFDIEFHVPMPKSWPKWKKECMNGTAHQQRPDLDNYLKAWKDSVYKEDAVVWKIKATKLWTDGSGHIVVSAY